MNLQAVLETTMLLAFGVAWPWANLRMLRTRQPDGRGLPLTLIVLTGYLAGAGAKWLSLTPGAAAPAAFWLYLVNSSSIGLNLWLQRHYRRQCAHLATV